MYACGKLIGQNSEFNWLPIVKKNLAKNIAENIQNETQELYFRFKYFFNFLPIRNIYFGGFDGFYGLKRK